MRLDVYLTENGLAKSRSYAAELIKRGYVTVDGAAATKASQNVENEKIEVTGELYPFVGRGGVKLDGALSLFGVGVTDFVCIDVGASTGGFTDCLLRRGAAKVFAVDSGHAQLDKRLLADRRVINLEGFNARDISPDSIGEMCDMAVCDLSFISQTYVLSQIASVLKDGGLLLSLIKPQFECGREAVGKGGIVKNKKHHEYAIRRVTEYAAGCALACLKLAPSPIAGGDGNREFTALFQKLREDELIVPADEKKIREVVG